MAVCDKRENYIFLIKEKNVDKVYDLTNKKSGYYYIFISILFFKEAKQH